MKDMTLRTARTVGAALVRFGRALRRDERGEGVISAAIAVLIMAGLGALMWIGFRSMWETTESNTNDKVAEIGR
jgi:hypothetical protein